MSRVQGLLERGPCAPGCNMQRHHERKFNPPRGSLPTALSIPVTVSVIGGQDQFSTGKPTKLEEGYSNGLHRTTILAQKNPGIASSPFSISSRNCHVSGHGVNLATLPPTFTAGSAGTSAPLTT